MTENGGYIEGGTSPLAGLKDRRTQIASAQELTLRVPRWENPEIYVVYRPLDHDEIRKSQKAADKAKGNQSEAELNGNADLLVKACKSVYAVLDGKRLSLNPDDPEGEFTTFDEALARNLDCPATGRAVARALFITDGDLIAHSRDLVRWSGYRDAEADEEFQGE